MTNQLPLAHVRDALRRHGAAGLAIVATLGIIVVGFAYAAGWLDPGRLAPGTFADALQKHDGRHEGFRRAHAKGICFTGHFDGNGQGSRLSKATVFGNTSSAVVGRFSTGGGMPMAADGRLVFHSMALSITASNGETWRTGMDHTPIFPVATPQAFLDLQNATAPAANGKPDPARVAAYMAAHPETRAFNQWMDDHPLPSSFANGTYYSINAFRFVDPAGTARYVRWSFLPETPFAELDKAKLASMDKNFLFDDVVARVAKAPLRWHLQATLAAPGDPTDDATREWPADREKVDLGTLTVDRVVTEDDGPCRDLNFDPLVLPPGIEGSNDPLLAVRSSVYASSFRRRAAEGPHPSAQAAQGGHHE
jgi:catalase